MALKQARDSFSLRKKGEGKVIFITGGSGRLGRNLARNLIRMGYTVRALSKDKDFVSTMPVGVVPYVGDITNKKVLSEACKGADIVFHLAAIVSQYKAGIQELMRVNVEGTAKVLEVCRLNGVGHLVFSSTVDVYGHSSRKTITEEHQLKPEDKYGYSKMLAEKEIEKYDDKVDYTILRIASIYGSGFEHSYFKVFKALKEGKAYIIGDGKNHLAVINVEDVVNGLLLAGENRKGSRNIYNLTDGMAYTQEELMDSAAELLKVEKPKRHISPLIVNLVAKSRGLDSDELRFLMSNRIVDISKIKKELGYKPAVTFKDGASDLVREFLNE